jgi:hypothetical protein
VNPRGSGHAVPNGLNATKALIFRVTHVHNVSWILKNGLYCQNSETADPNFVSIGNPELIEKRRHREVPVLPGGVLSDYVPFYFSPYSPMMYNIKTGWGGITRRRNDEIAILVSSLHRIQKNGRDFAFTDRHAYLEAAEFYKDLGDLTNIDWPILQNRDFHRDANDPGKVERYQAEALIHQWLPPQALLGLVCYTEGIADQFRETVSDLALPSGVKALPGWYF